MRKVAAMMLGVALASSYASAGTVEFSGNREIDISAPGPVSLDVTIVSSGQLDAVDLVIGADLPVGFTYAPGLTLANQIAPSAAGIFVNDVFISANNPSAVDSPLLLGTATFDPTGLALTVGQTFSVFVDNSQDFGISNAGLRGAADPLAGSATITVVPEPATMTLLGLAAVGLIRRRRSA